MYKVIDTIDSLLRSPSLAIRVEDETLLRLLQPSDAEQLFLATDMNRAHLREWLPWVDSNQTVLDTRRFIKSVVDQFRAHEGFQCGIWHRGDFAGVVGFHRIDWMNKNVEIGYWLRKDFEGTGLMTKSCRSLVDYAFRELKLKRVQIRCATGNSKSCRIPERLGFRKEGIALQAEYLNGRFVDLVIYGMSDSMWASIGAEHSSADLVLSGANPADVETIDALIKALYESVTFSPGARPDFVRLRSLCHFGAKFIPPRNQPDRPVSVLHTEEFIARSDKHIGETDLGKKGFYEKEVARRTELFGTVAHVLSGYESRYSKADTQPFARGVNSIQLVKDRNRWWVLSVAWDSERPENPLPRIF